MDSIKQAVFLCGGFGTRLRPITNTIPKPIVPINGKPFLYYLLKQLVNHGIKRFLLLTGYKGDQISRYFGNGEKWGWEISYSHGSVEWSTCRRIWEAKDALDAYFLLCYSDNFLQINLEDLYKRWVENNSILTAHIFEKEEGNVIINDDHLNCYYNYKNEQKIKRFVELGYILSHKKNLLGEMENMENAPNICFSEVIKKISIKKRFSGIIIKDQYYSVSDPIRLELTRKYLTPKRIILLDRDGTINKKAEKGKYITSWDKFKFIQKNIEGLKVLGDLGFEFIIITNQAGVSTNEIDLNTLNEIHKKMTVQLNLLNIRILKIYVSIDHWGSNSFRRKPNPGMLFEASKEFHLRLDHTFFIGDDERDCLAAANAGCGSLFLTESDENIGSNPDFHAGDIKSLVPFILKRFSKFEKYY